MRLFSRGYELLLGKVPWPFIYALPFSETPAFKPAEEKMDARRHTGTLSLTIVVRSTILLL